MASQPRFRLIPETCASFLHQKLRTDRNELLRFTDTDKWKRFSVFKEECLFYQTQHSADGRAWRFFRLRALSSIKPLF
jgi:hypothetical protein